MTEPQLELNGQQIAEQCKHIIPGQNDDQLLQQLQSLAGDFPVRLALAGEEWYRLGGVVDMQGNRIANDLVEWVERTYLECGQDLQVLIEHAQDQKLIATKQTGKSLYFVVQTSSLAEQFVLIEIDKTREMSDRMLVDPDNAPEDLEEFIDPLQPLCIESYGFGHSRYHYRRKTDVALFMEVVNERHVGEHPVQRFIDDWNRSSIGNKVAMSQDWIIRPYRHVGRFGEQIVNVELVNIHKNNLPHLQDFAGMKGQSLSQVLSRFDRQAGYPFAWFFYMLKGKQVSTHCAEAVFRDLSADFAYLPKRDEAVLRDWIASPYNI